MYVYIYYMYIFETVPLYETSTQGQNYACYHWNGTGYPGLLLFYNDFLFLNYHYLLFHHIKEIQYKCYCLNYLIN